MLTTKLEVLVDFGVEPDQKLLNKTLSELKSKDGVKEAVFKEGAIIIETTLPSAVVLDTVIKTSGKRAVLQGFGDTQSAVAMISSEPCGSGKILGVVRFQQSGDGALVLDGSVDGLTPGLHGLHARESGDLSQGCHSIGGHYNPHGTKHGDITDPIDKRHAGDLGNVVADENGRSTFRLLDTVLKINDLIGRSIAITEKPDDLGRAGTPESERDGSSGRTIACGIIARSAGIFQNPKRICACDGVLVWDERDRPLAGKGRRDNSSCCKKEATDGGKEGNRHCCKC